MLQTIERTVAIAVHRLQRAPRQKRGWVVACVTITAALAVAPSTVAQAPPSREACLAPLLSHDADVIRAAAEIEAAPQLCLGTKQVEENGVVWHFTLLRNFALPGPLWVVPHDEEDAAFVAGVAAVRGHGGVMIAVENGEARMVAGRDPNRVFALTAAQAEMCATPPAPLLVAAHVEEWDRAFPIIGLHSNWDGYTAAGGQGTISVRRPDAKMVPFPSVTAAGRFADEDTIVMLPGLLPPAADPAFRDAIAWFNSRGVHVLARLVTAENDECTIADFLTLSRRAPYLNIEVEFGDVETEKALVTIVWDFLTAGPAGAARIDGR